MKPGRARRRVKFAAGAASRRNWGGRAEERRARLLQLSDAEVNVLGLEQVVFQREEERGGAVAEDVVGDDLGELRRDLGRRKTLRRRSSG